MKINVQSVNFNVDQKLVTFINQKLAKLENHFSKIISADVYLKVDNTSAKENKVTEILLNIPGTEFMVKKTFKTFEEGVDQSVKALDKQLEKWKEKAKVDAI